MKKQVKKHMKVRMECKEEKKRASPKNQALS